MHFAHPIDFFALPILKKKKKKNEFMVKQVWFLFGVIPGFIRAILEQYI